MSYMSELYATMATLETYMVAVAVALGNEWTFQPVADEYKSVHYVGDLLGPGNMELGVFRIAYGHNVGRLQIRGEYSRLPGYDRTSSMVNHVTYPSITVAPTRRADVVASDIVKRLLPKYLPLFAQVRADLAANMRYRETGEATAARLAAIAGRAYKHHGRGTYTIRLDGLPHGRGYGDIEVSGDYVSVNMRGLTADVVAACLATVLGGSHE